MCKWKIMVGGAIRYLSYLLSGALQPLHAPATLPLPYTRLVVFWEQEGAVGFSACQRALSHQKTKVAANQPSGLSQCVLVTSSRNGTADWLGGRGKHEGRGVAFNIALEGRVWEAQHDGSNHNTQLFVY